MLLPFRDALMAGVQRGQRLSCSFATLERIRAADVVVSGGTGERCYRYSNIVTGQCVESPMLDRLVEQWIEDLDKSARFSTALRAELLARRGIRGRVDDECE
jgi:hypothetical protein